MFRLRGLSNGLTASALLFAAALLLHGVARANTVPLAPGGDLTKTSWESDKADTGGSSGHASSNTYTVTFASTFGFKDVHWTVEGPDGKPLPADGNNKSTGFRVKKDGETKGNSDGGNATSGSVDADCGAGSVSVEIDVTTEQAQIRLHLTFTTKNSAQQSMVLPDLINSDGYSDDARPIFAGSSGVTLSVKNLTPDSLTFGHYSVVGASWPSIDTVNVIGATSAFTVTIDPSGQSFSFAGGSLGSGDTLQIEVVFATATPGLGAVIGGLRAN